MKIIRMIRRISPIACGSFMLVANHALGADEKPDLPFTSGSTGVDGALNFSLPIGFTPARYGLSAAYDAARQQVVLQGGRITDAGDSFDDTWIWDGQSWRATAATGPRLYGCATAYDAARQQIVLPGSASNYLWDGAAWIQQGANSGLNRGHYAIAYDEARQLVILFGGGGNPLYDDTWSWNGTTWAKLNPVHKPSARRLHAMAYDVARQQIVLFGGAATWPNLYPDLNDTWVWDGADWVQTFPATSPSPRYGHAMAYDAARQRVVLFGGANESNELNDTWLWDGTNWSPADPPSKPWARSQCAMTYDAARQQVVLVGGIRGPALNDTWTWDGATWTLRSAATYVFDMSSRPSGVWNFTTIEVPTGVSVTFSKNAANTPVRWLATGEVLINGSINLSGEEGNARRSPLVPAAGGPGGFAGGLGGILPDVNNSRLGTAGEGPGGGLPAESPRGIAESGKPTGNSYLQPLFGGSGGGGNSGNPRGGKGGGGGGSILISSSRDIIIGGSIGAGGGRGEDLRDSGGAGGSGSQGAIRLQADRITVLAGGDTGGAIRLESYYRELLGSVPSTAILSGPVATHDFDRTPSPLQITHVAGSPVAELPRGDLLNPDVMFMSDGEVKVEVKGTGIPDGTPVRLQLLSRGATITKPAEGEPNITLSGGTATITVIVPKGAARLQAFADVTSR